MSLNQLPRLLAEMPEFKRIISDINKNGDTNLKIQLMSEAIPFILAGLSLFDNKTIMVLVSKPEDARVLYDQLLIWIDKKAQKNCYKQFKKFVVLITNIKSFFCTNRFNMFPFS